MRGKDKGERRRREKLTGIKSSPTLNLKKNLSLKKKNTHKPPTDLFYFFHALNSSSPRLFSPLSPLSLSPSGPLPCSLPPLSLPLSLSLLGRFEDRVVSQDLAELVEAMLHLGNAGQLGLQPLLLLGECEARRSVQLLEAPASLPVELQQVGVVLPGGGERMKAHLICCVQ